jgi:hypothetical protein
MKAMITAASKWVARDIVNGFFCWSRSGSSVLPTRSIEYAMAIAFWGGLGLSQKSCTWDVRPVG